MIGGLPERLAPTRAVVAELKDGDGKIGILERERGELVGE